MKIPIFFLLLISAPMLLAAPASPLVDENCEEQVKKIKKCREDMPPSNTTIEAFNQCQEKNTPPICEPAKVVMEYENVWVRIQMIRWEARGCVDKDSYTNAVKDCDLKKDNCSAIPLIECVIPPLKKKEICHVDDIEKVKQLLILHVEMCNLVSKYSPWATEMRDKEMEMDRERKRKQH